MTRWYNPSEKLPHHNEQVLVRYGNQIDIALFDAEVKIFQLRNGASFLKTDNITWMELLRPEGF